MKSIYACKLYRASNRKDKIRAAIENPLNAELVQQLASYLDEEYKPTAESTPNQSSNNIDKEEVDKKPSGVKPAKHPSGDFSGIAHPSGSVGDDLDDLDDFDTDNDDDDLEPFESEGSEDSSDSEDDNTLSESTNVKGQSITASECLIPTNTLEEIKGILNLSEDTAGAYRVRVKDSELWIYYNDNTNLNNVMTYVVEKLEACGYHYLEFNRLARSENSIVFEINMMDTQIQLENKKENK